MKRLSLLLMITAIASSCSAQPTASVPVDASNDADSSAELVDSWRAAGTPNEAAKRSLITSGRIFIDRKPPGAVPPVSEPSAWQMTAQEVQDCQARIEVARTVGDGKEDVRPTCWISKTDNDAPPVVDWLIASIESKKGLVFAQPIMKLYTPGYKFDDHFVQAYFFINDHRSFEESIVKSVQLVASADGLLMNTKATPQEERAVAERIPASIEELQGTQILIGRIPNRYKDSYGTTRHGVCIYSLHGNSLRSMEGLNCFGNVDPRTFSNKYVQQYLDTLRSIRLGG